MFGINSLAMELGEKISFDHDFFQDRDQLVMWNAMLLDHASQAQGVKSLKKLDKEARPKRGQ